LTELRQRTPSLRQREREAQRRIEALDADALDADRYLQLTQTLEAFLQRLSAAGAASSIQDRQRVVRLVVERVEIDTDRVIIRHCIPVTGDSGPSSPLRTSRLKYFARVQEAVIQAPHGGDVRRADEELGVEQEDEKGLAVGVADDLVGHVRRVGGGSDPDLRAGLPYQRHAHHTEFRDGLHRDRPFSPRGGRGDGREHGPDGSRRQGEAARP
jgi:hypothetical protein